MNARVSASTNVSALLRSPPMIYCFERCSTLIAMDSLACIIGGCGSKSSALTSNDVGEAALNPLEIGNADKK